MKLLVEVIWQAEVQPIDGDTMYEKGRYYLLHFGIDYRIIELGDGRIAAVNYTTAVCQHCETGQIEVFLPKDLRVIGKQIKDQW